jgi:TRAP-type C4-dicarboxylate transport system permease small subunit
VEAGTQSIFVLAVTLTALAALRAWCDRFAPARRVFGFLGALEVGVLAALLGSLMLLGGLQIVLRNAAHTGLLWADPVMRHIVLWLGCLGAALATSRLRHINIDVFSRMLHGRALVVRDAAVHGVTAVASFILAVAGWRLVVDERDFGDTAFLGLDTWWLQTVLPFSFLLIAYRSIVNLLLRRRPTPEGAMESEEDG